LLYVHGDQYEHGNDHSLAAVVKMMPNKVKRRRKIQTESGVGNMDSVFATFRILQRQQL